jgi:DNA-binding CsgD family transcriptional regulator
MAISHHVNRKETVVSSNRSESAEPSTGGKGIFIALIPWIVFTVLVAHSSLKLGSLAALAGAVVVAVPGVRSGRPKRARGRDCVLDERLRSGDHGPWIGYISTAKTTTLFRCRAHQSDAPRGGRCACATRPRLAASCSRMRPRWRRCRACRRSWAHEAQRAGVPAAALLERLAASCESRLVSAYARHASAKAARDGSALIEVAEEMAAIGALRYGVEAATDAATAFVAGGRQDSARRAAARARHLHVPEQGAELPRIDGLDVTAIDLTPREAQLVDLARQGLSNAEIADRLVISIRTVETHLYRGMQKLGIKNRHDL